MQAQFFHIIQLNFPDVYVVFRAILYKLMNNWKGWVRYSTNIKDSGGGEGGWYKKVDPYLTTKISRYRVL